MEMKKDWDTDSIKHYKSVELIKKQLRKSNSKYLSHHPEIRAILRVFLHEAINHKPTNIYEFAAKLFDCNNCEMLVMMINQQLKRVNEQLKKGHWSEFDGETFLDERESTHSLLSKSSVAEHAEALMQYSLVLKHPEGCNQ